MLTTLIFVVASLGDLPPAPDIPVHKEPLSLDQALAYAEANNERMGLAAANVESARATWWNALSALLPTVQVSGTYTRRAFEVVVDDVQFQRFNALGATGEAQVDLIKPDAYPRVSAASEQIHAAESAAKQERLALRFDAAEQFFATLAAERVAEAARRRVEVAQAAVDDASERFRAGLAAGNTVTRAELELATARVTATETENEAQIARLTLSFTLGVDVLGELVEPKAVASASEDSQRLFQLARGERFDLEALRYRKDAAEVATLAPKLDWLPELSLRGVYTATNEPAFIGRDTNWNIFATLGWQLFDGGVRIADAIETSAALRRFELEIRSLERDVRLRIENQLRQIKTSRALVAEAEARLALASRNADEVKQRLQAGLSTGLEAADAAASLFDAQAELERQRFEARIAELGLRREVASDPLEPVQLQ